MNPYEKAREERIKRNNAMLAQLEIRQHAENLAAPVAAAAEAEARKLANKRAQLAAVEPRQRSKRTSAAQAKAALRKQAKALERGSDSSSDAADSAVESEEPSADARSTGRGRKRKADADVEDDYDPLEDHSDAQNADSSASEAEASDESGDVRDSSERPRARRSMAGRQKQRDSTGRQSRASRRAELPMPVHTVPDVSGSEEDDYELQQALAMSMLDSQLSSDPRAAQQQPVAAPAASAKASVTAQQGYTSQQKPSVKKEAIALDQEPEALTLDVEDIKSAEGEASRDRASLPGSSGAAPLQKPAGKVTAAGKSRAAASDSQANKKGKAAAGIEESGGPKGRKRPAKGKAIEIYDPAEINKAFDLISDGSSSIREHMLQKVWDDVRGGKLDQLACNNMMTFAADITGTDKLDRAAFKKLCEHFT